MCKINTYTVILMKSKEQITITVDKDVLAKFDDMAGSRLIARSKLINQLMKNECNRFTNRG